MRTEFRAGDWDGLKRKAMMLSVHGAHEAVRDIAENAGLRSPLDGLIEPEGHSIGTVLAGGILRYRAWRIRGGYLAEDTPGSTMQAYGDVLLEATDMLDAALAVAPRDPLACGFRSSISVEEDHDGKRAALKRVQEADGDIAAGALGDVLSAWTYKWGMSQDDMWDAFARLHVPDRIATLALVPQAHWEQQTYYRWFDRKAGRAGKYYRAAAVRQALAEASDRALEAPADTDAALLRYIDSWMARVFVDAGDSARARAHFGRLGRHVEVAAWSNGLGLMSNESRFRWSRRRSGLWFS